MPSDIDEKYMAKAIAVAQQARLHSPPNPWVGAILVANDQIIGEGATGPFRTDEETNKLLGEFESKEKSQFAGSVHAEIKALEEAGELAKGATLYTTLEPCNHQGLSLIHI